MATENDQAVSRRIAEEAFSSGNFTVIDEFVHPDYVAHDPSVPEAIRGREGVRAFISMYRTATLTSTSRSKTWLPRATRSSRAGWGAGHTAGS